MKKTFIIWMIAAVLFSACGGERNNGMDSQVISSQVTDNTGLPEKDITASGGTISEETVSSGIVQREEIETGERSVTVETEEQPIMVETEEQPIMVDTEERNHNYWYTEPDPQDTFMLRVEGNISANQAWVDFLKGEMPDYTGMDFSDRIFAGLNRPYTLQDMEGYSLDLWAYGQKEYVEDGGILTNIQIFPYDVDADEEEELLFVCKSYAGMVKLWVLDEAYEDTWLLYPSISNWIPPGNSGRAWLWSNGFICYQARDSLEGCPNYINIYSQGKGGYFKLECNEYRSSDTLAQYYLDYEEGGRWKTADVVFDRNGTMIDGSLIYAGNVCTGSKYDDDLAIITQIYEETVGDAVPVRELTGLDGTEDGIIIVTREEFYSGAYLEN